MKQPKLAMCNFITDVDELKKTALAHGFSGIDWTFKVEDLPTNELDESRLVRAISRLNRLWRSGITAPSTAWTWETPTLPRPKGPWRYSSRSAAS